MEIKNKNKQQSLVVETEEIRGFGYSPGLASPFHGLKLVAILRLNPLKAHLISKAASMKWR